MTKYKTVGGMNAEQFIWFGIEKGWSNKETGERWRDENIDDDKISTKNKEILIQKLIELIDSLNILVKKKIESES